jgi:hypothetical protein
MALAAKAGARIPSFGRSGVLACLSSILRGLAIDNAWARLKSLTLTNFVNNTTGTPAAALVKMPVPVLFDATIAGGAQLVEFNATLVQMQNAFAVNPNWRGSLWVV